MTSASIDPDEENRLMRAIADGDRAAFVRLMDLHGSFALTLAARLTNSAADAEEVAQEAFLRVWRQAPDWRPAAGARFRTWLYRVVINLCLDRRRRRPFLALDDIAEPEAPDPDGLTRMTEVEGTHLVRSALSELPDRQRTALALSYFDGLSAARAAETMGVSVTALEALLVRGRRGLREALARRGLFKVGDVL
jgi:RNA polymerase sigma-70 factor (ECF subfamily)